MKDIAQFAGGFVVTFVVLWAGVDWLSDAIKERRITRHASRLVSEAEDALATGRWVHTYRVRCHHCGWSCYSIDNWQAVYEGWRHARSCPVDDP